MGKPHVGGGPVGRQNVMTPEQEAEINKQIDILTKQGRFASVVTSQNHNYISNLFSSGAVITVIDKPPQDSQREEDPLRSAERDPTSHYQ